MSDQAPETRPETREELLTQFVETNPEYYAKQFEAIGSKANFSWTFNPFAALLGPIWFGMRGLWNWGLPLVILEAFAMIQIARGLWGDLGAGAREHISRIEGILELRRGQLEAAIEKNADNIDVFKRAIESLENEIVGIRPEAAQADASAIWVALFGLAMLLLVKLIAGVLANPVLESRFSNWLSDRTISAGLTTMRTALSAGFVFIIFAVSMIHFSQPDAIAGLAKFPTDPDIRLQAISWVEWFFNILTSNGQWLFDIITYCIRTVLMDSKYCSSPPRGR